ncbi:MAG: hypothetical protein HON53_22150 [Planctomycetaceae bacterium]|nr:hypothetical protein [Planctomycetaceae bacterium]
MKELAINLKGDGYRVLCGASSFSEVSHAPHINVQQNVPPTTDTLNTDGALAGRA